MNLALDEVLTGRVGDGRRAPDAAGLGVGRERRS